MCCCGAWSLEVIFHFYYNEDVSLFLQKRRRDLIALGVCQVALETQTLTAINH